MKLAPEPTQFHKAVNVKQKTMLSNFLCPRPVIAMVTVWCCLAGKIIEFITGTMRARCRSHGEALSESCVYFF